MRKIILEKLQAKKGGSLKKLTPKGLDLLLTKIEAKVTSEDDIDSTIDDLDTGVFSFDDMVELVQKESDRKSRSVRTNLEKEFDLTPKKKGDDDDDDDDDVPAPKKKPGQTPDVAQLVADAVKTALEPFASLTKQIQSNDARGKLKAALKEKGIPEDWADDVTISDDFNQEDVLTRLDARWTSAKQIAVNQSIGDGTVLKGSTTTPSAMKEAIKDFGKTISPKESGINIQEM